MTKDLYFQLLYRKLEAEGGQQQAPREDCRWPPHIHQWEEDSDKLFCFPRVGHMRAELRPMTEYRKRTIQAVKEGFPQEDGFLEETATTEKALPKRKICWAGQGNPGKVGETWGSYVWEEARPPTAVLRA